jgi:hypothetical protein
MTRCACVALYQLMASSNDLVPGTHLHDATNFGVSSTRWTG